MDSRLVTVFIDLDDTLVHSGGHSGAYKLSLGGKEFLSVLESIPGIRVNFFSAGTRERNVKLLETVMADRFEKDVDTPCYTVYSREDQSLHIVKRGRFDTMVSQKKKKLAGLFTSLSLEHAIVVDDMSHFYSATGEERNFLQILCFWNGSGSEQSNLYVKHVAPVRLVRALGMLLWAVQLSKFYGWTPVEAVSAMQWYGGQGYRHSQTHSSSIYHLGLAAMKKVNPSFHVAFGAVSPWCINFEDAVSHNKFTNEQWEKIVSMLPKVENELDLVPPEGFNPEDLMRQYTSGTLERFPALPEEPKPGDIGTCSIAMRFPNGCRSQRRFFMHDKLACLWTFCRENVKEAAKGREFSLKTNFGPAIEYDPNITLGDAKVVNTMLIMAWDEPKLS